jgi:uncharacterized membrane protein YqiK
VLVAEADGKKASLMAEAEAKQQMELAPAMAYERMLQASAEHPELAVQFKMVDHLEGMTGNMAETLTMLKDANITIYGDTNTAAGFVNQMMSSIVPGMDMLKTGFKTQMQDLFSKGDGSKVEIPAPKTDQLKVKNEPLNNKGNDKANKD